jgi:hypothetical protein
LKQGPFTAQSDGKIPSMLKSIILAHHLQSMAPEIFQGGFCMFGFPNLEGLPQTIDQAADLLMSDLLTDHIEAMASLSEEEFESLYQGVAPYLIDEFRLWSGNNDLLAACMEACQAEGESPDPARVILKRVIERLGDTEGIIIIT